MQSVISRLFQSCSIRLTFIFCFVFSDNPCVKLAVLNRMYCTFFILVSLSMTSAFSFRACRTKKPLGEAVYLHSPSTRFPPIVSMATMLISLALAPQYLSTLSKWKFQVSETESSHSFSRQTSS